jgi:hypothetical protein
MAHGAHGEDLGGATYFLFARPFFFFPIIIIEVEYCLMIALLHGQHCAC